MSVDQVIGFLLTSFGICELDTLFCSILEKVFKGECEDHAMKIEDLKPWMRGPFELIRHADGHLKAKGDTDRRIALIGFDNAIEVSIDVFIRLHPKLRNGVEIPKAEVEAATRNYHTKIEFLDNHVQTRQIPLSISVLEILWFHQLRNELYHSGNGMVPEEHVILGARAAALAVFKALFKVDAFDLVADGRPPEKERLQWAPVQSENPQMEFLRWFIKLEGELRKLSRAKGNRKISFSQMWHSVSEARPELLGLNSLAAEVIQTRNSIVHGQTSVPEKDLKRQLKWIKDMINRLHW